MIGWDFPATVLIITEMTNQQKELFSVQLRKATKNIHDISDALVNAKLGVTINDDSVWAEGLLVFYEIFKFLETALKSHSDSLIGDLLIEHMERAGAFEDDLAFFYGSNWTENYTIRPEVQTYLDHLRDIQQENPYLLIPYVYHLYMGLFSGGQILQAKVVSFDNARLMFHSASEKISVSLLRLWPWLFSHHLRPLHCQPQEDPQTGGQRLGGQS